MIDDILVYVVLVNFNIISIMLAKRDKHANPMIVEKVNRVKLSRYMQYIDKQSNFFIPKN